MGLDTSHDAWHGAYSSFALWRKQLEDAAQIGDIDHGYYEWPTHQGMWRESPSDPLLVLLVHSDCDGYIFPCCRRFTSLGIGHDDPSYEFDETCANCGSRVPAS